jgi:hypothetical protein
MDEKPFLSLVTCLQRSAQLDLFDDGSTLADRIVKDVVDSILGAAGNLSSLDVQQAVHGARERAVALLSQFPHHAGMRPRRS